MSSTPLAFFCYKLYEQFVQFILFSQISAISSQKIYFLLC